MCLFLLCDLGLENTLEERVDSALRSVSTVIIYCLRLHSLFWSTQCPQEPGFLREDYLIGQQLISLTREVHPAL